MCYWKVSLGTLRLAMRFHLTGTPHHAYHHLGGKLKGVQAISITDSYRITLTVAISDKEIILLDVGSHDEVYR